jgi:hypothetical protein
MIQEPKIVNNVSHPFVSSAYIREDFTASGAENGSVKVLVIESVAGTGKKERETLYADFLANLEIFSTEAQRQGGRFDRVDIRFH